MVQAIMETIFDVLYLSWVLSAGFLMLTRGRSALVKRFGLMAVVLGGGDSFHLVPRMYALWTTGLTANAAALGVGKLITSITMTVFYLLLYYVWRERNGISGKSRLTAAMWALATVRVALCLLPQNDWLNANQPLLFGILRNIPFAAMGILVIALFARTSTQDVAFRHMPLAVALSFGFYLPVVLFSASVPAVGMLMIPKTLTYVWAVWMGYSLFRGERAARLAV